MIVVAAALPAIAILVIPSPRRRRGTSNVSNTPTNFVRSFATLRMSCGDLMRGGALVDGAVFRHLVIFHQTKAPIDQGLFVFVG
jgi:hypothetical protein